MFDTMTLTKILGGFCGALLIFLLGGWAAETLYHTGGGHGDHGAKQSYVIEVEGGSSSAEEVNAGPTIEELLADADVAKGANVFKKCASCHKLEDGQNGTGPHLYGVVGRNVGSVDGFGYSGALVAVADVWDAEALDGFLASPKKFAPGTKMAFQAFARRRIARTSSLI